MRGDATTSQGKRGHTTTRWCVDRQRRVNSGGSLAAASAAPATPAKLPPRAATVAGGNKDTGSDSDGRGTDNNQQLTKSGGGKGNGDGDNDSNDDYNENEGDGGSSSSLVAAQR
jgi:hypothetical protein